MAIPRFEAERSAVLVVDMQARLLPVMAEGAATLAAVERLLRGCGVLEVPWLLTEQYTAGLGPTVDELAFALEGAASREEKLKFSACIEPIRAVLVERSVRSVVVCGIEAHVCVLQTCLDLAAHGFVTGVCVDAVASRRAADRDVAIQRLVQAGVVPTTVESVLLEWTHEAGTARFKALLPFIK